MKNLIKIGTLSFAATLLFASCKKDRTCVCTTGNLSGTKVIENSTKKDAEETCKKGEIIIAGTTITSCELKK